MKGRAELPEGGAGGLQPRFPQYEDSIVVRCHRLVLRLFPILKFLVVCAGWHEKNLQKSLCTGRCFVGMLRNGSVIVDLNLFPGGIRPPAQLSDSPTLAAQPCHHLG